MIEKPQSKISRKMLMIAISALACAGMLLLLAVLLRHDAFCIARAGVKPSSELYDDPQAFRAAVEEMRGEALLSLVARFDTATGFFIYSAHPDGTRSKSDNDIRQLLASRVLAEESNFDETLRDMHRQNLAAVLGAWYQEEGDEAFVLVDGKSKLGANAMLARVLVASPLFDEHKEQARKLVRGIEALIQKDGSMLPWYREPSYAYDADRLLTFYSGEAILALVEYAEKTDDTAAFGDAVRSQDFYLKQYVENLETNYYPAYVPWHTQSLAKLYARTDEKRYADAIFILNDKVLEIQDRTEYIGRFYNPEFAEYGSPHGSSDAVYTEGLAYAYGIARARGDEERQKTYRDALVRAVHNLSRLQHEPQWWRFEDGEASERLSGGIKSSVCSRSLRIDTTAHTIDALTKILDA